MNLNFWQWLGVILLVGVGGYYIYDKVAGDDDNQLPSDPPASTQPM